MTEEVPNQEEVSLDNKNVETVEALQEILKSLENLPAVRAKKLFQSETWGNDVSISGAQVDSILGHPDAKLYDSIQTIISSYENKHK